MDRIGIIMHGVTGRMGYNQHLVRSILAIRDQGGVALGIRRPADARSDHRRARRRQDRGAGAKARHRALDDRPRRGAGQPRRHDLLRRRHDADARELLARAIDAGKHVYCEKPVSDDLQVAVALARKARASGLKHGVVQDKLFLPGLLKLKMLRDFGLLRAHPLGARRVRLLGVRGRLGVPAQRPSWNYRKADGGGIILDMLCHWRYVLDNLFGEVEGGHLPRRDAYPGAGSTSRARPTPATPTMRPMRPSSSKGGVVAHINSSWDVRVRRDDLVTFQVDGTHGSAVAGLHNASPSTGSTRRSRCGIPTCRRPSTSSRTGRRCRTPAPTRTASRRSGRCSCATSPRMRPWPYGLEDGAKGVQLASSASSRGRSGAGSTCRTWRSDDADDRTSRANRRDSSAIALTGEAVPVVRRRTRPDFPRIAYAAAHVVADPLADERSVADAGDRLGRDARASATGSGTSGSASPRRWTRRSAAWASAGPRRRS